MKITFFTHLMMAFFTIVPCIINAQLSLTEGLVAFYPLDGDARDLSGNCLNGQIYGATADVGVDGIFMKALKFDGIDDYVEIPNNQLFNFSEEQDFAISFWVKIAEVQADKDTVDNDIISKWVSDDSTMDHLKQGYPFTFRIMNGKSKQKNAFVAAEFSGYKVGCSGGTTLQFRNKAQFQFQHILLNVRRGKLYLYQNGKLKKRLGSNTFCTTQNNAPLRIGKRGGSEFQNHFKGAVDNLLIYNRALEEAEISQLADVKLDLIPLLNGEQQGREIVISDTLYFDNDVFQLNPGQRIKLAEFYKYLEIGTQYHLVIEGHTNTIPDDRFCDELSFKRAKVLEDYLTQLGISCHKITTKGLGKRHPITKGNGPLLQKKNQRAEIKLFKLHRA